MDGDTVGVGIDLLEIDRLERALERRPRLAERAEALGVRLMLSMTHSRRDAAAVAIAARQ